MSDVSDSISLLRAVGAYQLIGIGSLRTQAPKLHDLYMNDQYDPDSCNALEKPYYQPVRSSVELVQQGSSNQVPVK